MTMPENGTRTLLLFILLFTCFLNLFTNRDAMYPGIMEARNLITAREMMNNDNWLIPTMNNYPRLAKPPMPTWLNAKLAYQFPLSDLNAHRIPPALIAVLMIFSLFGISMLLTSSFQTAWITGMIASTSFYLVFMGRQSTWDIYCHALMTAAIYFLVLAWLKNKNVYFNHILAGILMGLSFLSKGPVAFYAMLLPFLVCWTVFMDKCVWRKYGKALSVCLIATLVIGLSWPVYAYLSHPELFSSTMSREVTAWSDRHVRPFYQYWGFWSHLGIWSVFGLATFFYPQMIRRMNRKKYLLLLGWTFLTVILLSIPAEKKERYLLPVLTPLILLTGMYIAGLFDAWRKSMLQQFDRVVLYVNSGAVLSACLVILYILTTRTAFSVVEWIFYPSIILLLGYSTIVRLRPAFIFAVMILLMSSVSLLVLPRLSQLIYTNESFESMSVLAKSPDYDLPFFSENINPVQIWELGKPVDTLRTENGKMIVPSAHDFVVLAREKMGPDSFNEHVRKVVLQDSVKYDPENPEKVYFMYTIYPF